MKQLLILSGKGGTGKTTLASAFIKLSNVKSYADCDVDAPNLHLIHELSNPKIDSFFGMPKAHINADQCIKCGLCKEYCRFEAINFNDEYVVDSVKCEGCGVCEYFCPVGAITLEQYQTGKTILYQNDEVFSTGELKMGSGNSGLLVTEVKNKMLRKSRDKHFSIIDGSPGIGCPVIASISGVDYVLIVAEATISGMSDLKRIVKTSQNFNAHIMICVNKYDINIEFAKEIEEYCWENGIDFVGFIPYDKQVSIAINNGISVVEIESTAGEAIRNIFSKIKQIINKKEGNIIED